MEYLDRVNGEDSGASSAAHSKKILASDSLSSEGPEEDNIVEGTPNACSGASMFGQSGHSVIPETQSQDLNYTKPWQSQSPNLGAAPWPTSNSLGSEPSSKAGGTVELSSNGSHAPESNDSSMDATEENGSKTEATREHPETVTLSSSGSSSQNGTASKNLLHPDPQHERFVRPPDGKAELNQMQRNLDDIDDEINDAEQLLNASRKQKKTSETEEPTSHLTHHESVQSQDISETVLQYDDGTKVTYDIEEVTDVPVSTVSKEVPLVTSPENSRGPSVVEQMETEEAEEVGEDEVEMQQIGSDADHDVAGDRSLISDEKVEEELGDKEKEQDNEEAPAPPEKSKPATRQKAKGKRGKVTAVEEEKEEEEEEEEEEAQKEIEKESEENVVAEEESHEDAEPPRSGRRGRQGKKLADVPAVAAEEPTKSENEQSGTRRSPRKDSSKKAAETPVDASAPRQLRDRSKITPAAKVLAAAQESSSESEPVGSTPKQKQTPKRGAAAAKTASSLKKGAKSPKIARETRKKEKEAIAEPEDPFDIEKSFEEAEKQTSPLKHVAVSRTSFGEITFTKTATPKTGGSKYASFRSGGGAGTGSDNEVSNVADTLPAHDHSLPESDVTPPPQYRVLETQRIRIEKISPTSGKLIKAVEYEKTGAVKTTRVLAPELKRQISPSKSSLSSGRLADSSSMFTEGTNTSGVSSGSRQRSKRGVGKLNESSTSAKSTDAMETDEEEKEAQPPKTKNAPAKRNEPAVVDDVMKNKFFTGIRGGKSSLGSSEKTKRQSTSGTNSSRASKGRRSAGASGVSLFSDIDPDVDDGQKAETGSNDEFTEPEPPKSAGGRKRGTPRVNSSSRSDRTPVSDSPASQPRQRRSRQSETPTLAPMRRVEPKIILPSSPEEQLEADFPTTPSSSLLPGARVLVKWTSDKNFYPANVQFRDGLGRYRVKYVNDGNIRDAPQPDLVPLSKLKPGDELMVSVELDDEGNEELQPVKIISIPSQSNSDDWYKGLYEVENASTEKIHKIPWTKFCIDKDQTKLYVTDTKNRAVQEIVAENITASRARTTRGRIWAPDAQIEEERMESPERSASPKRGRKRPAAGAVATPPKSAAKRAKIEKRAADETEDAALEDDNAAATGASPKGRQARLFVGYNFVLTSANRKIQKTGDGANDSSSEDERPQVPFNKREVRQLIESRGGVIVEDISSLDPSGGKSYLIADTSYRTHKYLTALTAAIPCVSHVWIHDCVDQKELLDIKNYMLPAGIGLEENQNRIEWHDRCPNLMKNLRVYVFTQQKSMPNQLDFYNIWAPMVDAMGAELVEALPKPGEKLDYLLTDATCPTDVVEKAKDLGAYAVSSEWLIQAIVAGELPKSDGHEKYAYDYQE